MCSAILNKGELWWNKLLDDRNSVSRRVDKVAVRVVQRGFERVFTSGLGELRTYNGSRCILKLVTGLSILL